MRKSSAAHVTVHEAKTHSNFPLTPPCTDEGALMEYEGDASISTDCGVTFASNVPGGGSGINAISFTATPALDIPANVPTLPGFCSVRFQVKVLASSTDATPDTIEALVGYDIADCDNGVTTSSGPRPPSSRPSFIPQYDELCVPSTLP